jgi:uncharacterized protein with von Willebrand factor type A (vWA) domain
MHHHLFQSSLYVEWDESLEAKLSPDELIDALAEDVLRDGNLDLSLQRAFRWGTQGQNNQGLNDLLQRLRQQRQQLLDQFDFGSSLDELRDRLDDIVKRESDTLEDRIEASRQLAEEQGEEGNLGDFFEKRKSRLDALPPETSAQIRDLQNYEFVDEQAGNDFADLVASMQQQIMDALFNNLMGSMSGEGNGSMQETQEFLHDLNEAFEQEQRGEQPDLDKLNNKWGNQLGGRVGSMGELRERLRSRMEAAQNMLNMLTPQQRADLLSMMQQSLQQSGLASEFEKLRQALGPLRPAGMQQSPMHGSESIQMDVAMQVLDQAAQMEQLEGQLRGIQHPEELAGLDPGLLKEVLSTEDQEWLDQWSHIEDDLVDAGFVRRTGRGLELTARAVRRIGEKALEDIFSNLRQKGLGEHNTTKHGVAGELVETSRPWTFGDPFALDLPRTVMNGVLHGGPGTPVRLDPEHFEVQDRESRTSTATVLAIDMSRSMIHNGCWDAAKRSALALDTLIRSKYPRDMLELIGFAATAHPLRMVDLPSLEWNEYTYGTNLQHALELAREKLRGERGRNRQVIVITDGEPTAHISHGRAVFEYPTSPETYEATLREVLRCTREGITINTFLLESTPKMRAFIEDLMRINRGKVIAVAPGHLGRYVLRDFMTGNTKAYAS